MTDEIEREQLAMAQPYFRDGLPIPEDGPSRAAILPGLLLEMRACLFDDEPGKPVSMAELWYPSGCYRVVFDAAERSLDDQARIAALEATVARMTAEVTDEDVQAFHRVFLAHRGDAQASYKAALTAFLERLMSSPPQRAGIPPAGG